MTSTPTEVGTILQIQLDAVEFCRAVSGRAARMDLFNQEVSF
jgi:hypothetical protein